MKVPRMICGASFSEWTATRGLVVHGDVSVFKSPTYVCLVDTSLVDNPTALEKLKIAETRFVGMTNDGRRILLDYDAGNHVLGIEIV